MRKPIALSMRTLQLGTLRGICLLAVICLNNNNYTQRKRTQGEQMIKYPSRMQQNGVKDILKYRSLC